LACFNGHPLIIELVGVAGAGKSSLRKKLMENNCKIVNVPAPSKFYYVSFLISHFFKWYPLYLKNYSNSRWFTRKEITQMAYLETWLPYLHRCAVEKDQMIVLDPGCVYWLINLKYFGPEITKSNQFINWWNFMKDKWSAALDLVVWLDAPVELLVTRVLRRTEWHECKTQPREDILRDFSILRKGYADMLIDFSKKHFKQFACYETDKITTNRIANEVLEKIKNF
jgi:deoxyadenosine/deoxycytidine kinase